jgi:hypothetical protein
MVKILCRFRSLAEHERKIAVILVLFGLSERGRGLVESRGVGAMQQVKGATEG